MIQDITLQEAIQLSGKCERTLRSWIKSGKLDAEKENGSYRIRVEELAKVTPVQQVAGIKNIDPLQGGDLQQSGEFAIVLQRHEQAIFRLGQLEMENQYLQENMKALPPPDEWRSTQYQIEQLENQLTQAKQQTLSLKEQIQQSETSRRELEKELENYKKGPLGKISKWVFGT